MITYVGHPQKNSFPNKYKKNKKTRKISNPLFSSLTRTQKGSSKRLTNMEDIEGISTSQSGDQRRVLVLNTGGTASMKYGEDGSLDTVPGYLTERIRGLEELSEPGMPLVEVHEYEPLIDSSHMEPSVWVRLAADIEKHYFDYDGFVIVMGTDTMAFAASALSFLLENLGKTVIFTGSQIPLCMPYTDCRRNVLVSIILAANGDYPEVCLFFSDKLFRGCRATKINSFGLEAFGSPNYPPLTTLATGAAPSRGLSLPQPRSRFRAQKVMATGIIVIKLIPGFDDAGMHALIESANNLLAVIIEVYGSGGAPYQKPGMQQFVSRAMQHGVLVIAKSQCMTGSVLPQLYAANSTTAVASAGDMTSEALVAKLAYLFAKLQSNPPLSKHHLSQKVSSLLSTSLRGEISPAESYSKRILAVPKASKL
eukprot:TRINITY_DN5714_c0_g2_i1.p1 TRINITY_DN5714_c0_g2~~TRINITY_DN5714_c0_g2_i1.p1  ORF type:complete len:423 (+),score=45.96 TRINITY_DN5714_c0_g2_i1:236-1504(+)